MKKIFFVFLILFFSFLYSYADEIQDIQCFFNRYIDAANSYSCNYFDYYCDNAKILRVVEKPDGTQQIVTIPFDKYKKEVKNSGKLARLRNYKNKYYNVKIHPIGKDYKVLAMRMPSTSDYKIPAYFIIGKDCDGNWKIKEESMNTRVQRFLSQN